MVRTGPESVRIVAWTLGVLNELDRLDSEGPCLRNPAVRDKLLTGRQWSAIPLPKIEPLQ